MKKNILMSLMLFAVTVGTFAQGAEFRVEISPDEILMDNYFEVRFILKNAGGSKFVAPDFKDFNVVAGPNQSSSFRMVNGAVDQSLTYSFYLAPGKPGNFFVEPASIEVDGVVLETLPVEVVVMANPDGIKKEIPQDNPGFDNDLNMDHFFDFNFPFDKEKDSEAPTKPKKKRKVYKL